MKIVIVAEIGVNHNGNLTIARKLIDKAKKAKVDYVKFQSFVTEDLVTNYSDLADYQKKNKLIKSKQFDLLKKYELTFEDQLKLFSYCKIKKIKFLSTPFEDKSLEFLKNKIKIIKISSTDLGNLPFLKKIGKLKKKVYLSTGMSNTSEINMSIKELVKGGMKRKDITILHCTSSYPTNPEDLNLTSIKYLKKKFRLPIGFSDHSEGLEASVAAVTLGATVVEKHFTLDKKMKGPDHSSSLNFKQLKKFVKQIRNIEKSIGKFQKKLTKNEKKNKKKLKKSIVAKKKIQKNEIFNKNNITTKRPGSGISPLKWYSVLGKKAKKTFKEDEQIKL